MAGQRWYRRLYLGEGGLFPGARTTSKVLGSEILHTDLPALQFEHVIIHHSHGFLLHPGFNGTDLSHPPALSRAWCLYEVLVARMVGEDGQWVMHYLLRNAQQYQHVFKQLWAHFYTC